MRLYTVASIDSWIMMQGPKGAQVPRLGKNGGQLCVTDGMISSHHECELFVAQKITEGAVSTSKIRKWKGQ
jgi:hypothetical protein